MSEKEIFDKLKEGLIAYDREAVEKAAREVIDEGLDILEAMDVLTTAIREIGEKYAEGVVFLPELMMAGDTMKAGMAVFEPKLKEMKKEVKEIGTVVIGTVEGDIHEIGKSIVGTMLTAAGFKVIDVGMDVSTENFLKAAEGNNVDIVGLSALMTTTMIKQGDVIEYFKEKGVRDKYKIIVGGGPVTKEYAEEIGADGYGKDADEAVDLAKKLLAK